MLGVTVMIVCPWNDGLNAKPTEQPTRPLPDPCKTHAILEIYGLRDEIQIGKIQKHFPWWWGLSLVPSSPITKVFDYEIPEAPSQRIVVGLLSFPKLRNGPS
jgi:hypothetical protein